MLQNQLIISKRKLTFSLCIFLLSGLLAIGLIHPAWSQSEAGIQALILESGEQSIVVAVTTGSYQIETVTHANEEFQRIQMAGASQTITSGMPQVPLHGVMLGIPMVDGVSVEIVDADYETLTGYRMYPAPLRAADDVLTLLPSGTFHEDFTLDSNTYTTDVFYPSALATLGQAGYMRDQAVVQVQFYPVQFNPVRSEVRVYHRIVVRVTWPAEMQAASADERYQSPAYESLLSSTLLNYDSLHRPTSHKSDNVTNPQNQFSSVANSAAMFKIGISESGIYRISYTDLTNAGINLSSIDPRLLKMTNRGQEVAIYVYGEEDGVFNETDYLLFYGVAINDMYTKQNIYWLFMDSDIGQRTPIRNGSPVDNAAVIERFRTTILAEENTTYWRAMPGSASDRWFWETRLSPNADGLAKSRKYQIQLGSVAPGNLSATVRVRLHGFTKSQHRTRIYVNSKSIDEQTWYGQVEFTHQVEIPQTLLRIGTNEIEIETIENGSPVDQILVNWIELDYWGAFNTQTGELSFEALGNGQQKFRVEGFSSNDVTIWDVSAPLTPVRIVGAVVTPTHDKYSLIFTDNIQASGHYILLAPGKYKSPNLVIMDQPSTWRLSSNGADYIIITHENFYESALALAAHRRASGMRVAVVLVQDLYDEFNYGIFNPIAIRDFIVYAYGNWQGSAPTYVTLIGDANQDYKDNLKNGTINYVPSQNIIIDGSGEVSSDNWFAAINGNDNLPDLLIGRLVAQSTEEINAMVEKIIHYEQTPTDNSWNKSVSFIATDEEPMFLELSEQLANQLPYYYQINRIYVTNQSPGNVKADILTQIERGTVLLNYAGHGWYFGWGRQDTSIFFENPDVNLLNNINRLPIITVANCLNGFFAGPKDKPALAEVLLRRKNAGAVAVWAPTDFGDPTGHRILLSNLYQAIFVGDQQTIGAATTAAKLATFTYSSFWRGLIDTYILFGDPAMKLGIATNFSYLKATSPTNDVEGVSLDQRIRLVFSKPVAPETLMITNVGAENLDFQPYWNADFTIADFSHTNFEHGKKYQFVINGQDRLGNPLGPGTVPNPWSFTVTTDAIAPEGWGKVQGGDSPFALTTAVIDVGFTKPVRVESVVYSIVPTVKGSLSWYINGQQATFLHERFKEGQTYTFTILAAKDIAGNSLSKPVQVTFTVGKTLYVYLPSIFHKR